CVCCPPIRVVVVHSSILPMQRRGRYHRCKERRGHEQPGALVWEKFVGRTWRPPITPTRMPATVKNPVWLSLSLTTRGMFTGYSGSPIGSHRTSAASRLLRLVMDRRDALPATPCSDVGESNIDFFVNIGAGWSIVSSAKHLRNVRACSHIIFGAGNTLIEATFEGDLAGFVTLSDGCKVELVLRDVWCVPGLATNQLSVSNISQQEAEAVF
ncbi:unnamed protein product, partial [Phaeothamnion confervicola]